MHFNILYVCLVRVKKLVRSYLGLVLVFPFVEFMNVHITHDVTS